MAAACSARLPARNLIAHDPRHEGEPDERDDREAEETKYAHM
jgi:hypothetical protein